ncbi:alanine aminotransferase 1-like isoform X1 [Zophobas morio]|uniref:alanine aminotransferase 1-like isoform X1 n=1 Tax=Zophobas morio TaxID=2755281 RepID=UPI0030832977
MEALVNLLSETLFSNFLTVKSFVSRKFTPRINCNVSIQTRRITVSSCQKTSTPVNRTLTMKNINPQIPVIEYAVRGAVLIRATEIEKELQNGVKKPFTEVIRANLGDCHAMGQIPITFIRQVLALVTYPKLFNEAQFPSDAKERAKQLLDACRGSSVGSYTDSPGIELIRKHVAEYIQKRDGGIPSDWQDIILTSGASPGIKDILKLMIYQSSGLKSGVMTPIPEYPLYAATLTEYDMIPIGYYLDESNNWGLDMSELQTAVNQSRAFSHPRAIVVINPGNPTGQVLTKNNVQEIIKFAYKERLFILADEVYQYNIYDPESQFFSFKKVMKEMGKPYSEMEVASFMSCSKGYMGECGIRAGFVEIINMDPEVKKMLFKAITTSLCPTVLGQVTTDIVVNSPKEGEPSYNQFIQEKTTVLESLRIKAKLISETFNTFKGFSCNPVQGAMYAFPQIKLPPKAIEEAEKQKKHPDVFYAFDLLEHTGICIIPGSGFGQDPGTYHFRTTILMPVDKLKTMLEKFRDFHTRFVEKYS